MKISHIRKSEVLAVAAVASIMIAACSSEKVASRDAVQNSSNSVVEATSAGATDLAPREMGAAQEKLAQANKALADKDYKAARSLADEAQVDAKAAAAKANSIKAQQAAAAVQNDIRALREELDRADSRTE
jgi:hypothetical protein